MSRNKRVVLVVAAAFIAVTRSSEALLVDPWALPVERLQLHGSFDFEDSRARVLEMSVENVSGSDWADLAARRHHLFLPDERGPLRRTLLSRSLARPTKTPSSDAAKRRLKRIRNRAIPVDSVVGEEYDHLLGQNKAGGNLQHAPCLSVGMKFSVRVKDKNGDQRAVTVRAEGEEVVRAGLLCRGFVVSEVRPLEVSRPSPHTQGEADTKGVRGRIRMAS